MAPSSLSEHFYERLRDSPELLEELWSETDAYVSWTGPSAQGHLPGLNWNTDFRKAYTLLIWLRPHIVTEESKENNKEELPSESSSAPRILYRFSTSPDDSEATGVCVFCSEWTYRNSAFEATLTAKSYPSQQEMTAPLTLKADEWHLVGFTHVFPFLKHPTLTVTINGQAVAHGELAYPVLEEDYQMMEHNYLMRHILTPAVLGEGEETNEGKNDEGVAEKLKEEASKESPNTTEKEREAKKEDTPEISQVASEEIPGIMQDVSLTSACEPRTPWQLDLAAFALYPVAIGSSIQAVTAQAGPHLALQSQDGRILPTLPPVCNW